MTQGAQNAYCLEKISMLKATNLPVAMEKAKIDVEKRKRSMWVQQIFEQWSQQGESYITLKDDRLCLVLQGDYVWFF